MLAWRLGLIGVAIDHLDGPDARNLAAVAGLEESIAVAERDFRLIDFDHALQEFPIRVDHRSAQFLGQQPGGLVSDAELILQLARRHAVGMGRHEMRRPEPRRQRQLGTIIARSRRGRSLSAAIEAFACMSATLSGAMRRPPPPNKQNRRTNAASTKMPRSSPRRETSVELRKRSAFGHCAPRRRRLKQQLNHAAIPHLGLPGTAG